MQVFILVDQCLPSWSHILIDAVKSCQATKQQFFFCYESQFLSNKTQERSPLKEIMLYIPMGSKVSVTLCLCFQFLVKLLIFVQICRMFKNVFIMF